MADQRPVSYIQPLTIRPRESRAQPKGLTIINLGFNELPFPPPESVASAIDLATASANSYGNPSCVLLREAIAMQYKLDPERIVCGNGSEELLDIIGRCFARSGDEIVVSEFGYIQFPIVANRVGASLVKAKERFFTTQVDDVLAAVTDKTRIVFIANPNNPTGTMVSAQELHRLAKCLPSDILLVLDLAYAEFANESYAARVHDIASQFDNIIVTQTFSKAFGLAGLRVGWCHAPAWTIPSINAARGMGSVNAAAQAGALAALNEMPLIKQRVDTIIAQRERVAAALTSLEFDVIPSSANFLLVAPPNSNSELADSFSNHLFDDTGIVVNQTREAGLERFVRFSLSTVEHNSLLLDSAENFIRSMQSSR
ncbi:MAG: histidinol-phosphate transaminase [Granulosicoccus sp.]